MNYAAVVILGSQMDRAGDLQATAIGRVELALAVFREQLVLAGQALSPLPVLLASGWAYRDDSAITIGDAMKDYILAHSDVPSAAVITELHARETVGDAVFIKRNLALPQGWKNILVVTSDFHVARVLAIFDFVFAGDYQIDVIGAVTDEPERAAEEVSLAAFRQTFTGIAAGDDEAIYNCLRERHPYYNGTVYPQIDSY